jgi:hypothetical protein
VNPVSERTTFLVRLQRHARALGFGLGLSVTAAPGCVGEPPEDVRVLDGPEPLELESDEQLAVAHVQLEGDALVQGSNVVDVAFVPADGASAVTLVDASAFMPAHGHGTNAPIVVDAGDGYRLEDLNLFMPGHWEITLDVRVGDADDSFLFAAEVR